MKQREALDLIATAIEDRGFTNVRTLTAIEGDQRTIILARWFDTHLSVTVEILAQP